MAIHHPDYAFGRRFALLLTSAVAPCFLACSPGYIGAGALNSREQGPTHCASRCHDLGMEMGALVLVADQLPGCVCMPKTAPRNGPGGPPPAEGASQSGSAAATGYVVMASAEAAKKKKH